MDTNVISEYDARETATLDISTWVLLQAELTSIASNR
jgi:hypothetical protein